MRPARSATAGLLALGLAAVVVGLVAVALLGPLGTGAVSYRVSRTLRDQVIGLDAVSLFVVAPLGLVAAALVVRRRALGAALALGIGAYTSYMFLQYILGPDYTHRPGNNELIFPLCLALFAAGWLVALLAWQTLEGHAGPITRRERAIGRIWLPLLALVAFGRYVPALSGWMQAHPSDAGYLAGPTFAWTIALLDLGVFLPATVLTCVGLRRRAPWARPLLDLVAGWFGLVGAAVAAMALTMHLDHDPSASFGNTALMIALGVAFLALAVAVLRPVSATRPSRDSTAVG